MSFSLELKKISKKRISFKGLVFRSSHFCFSFLVTFGNKVTKIWKYYVIFAYILQGKMGKTAKKRKENHATNLTKVPKTKRRKYLTEFTKLVIGYINNWPLSKKFNNRTNAKYRHGFVIVKSEMFRDKYITKTLVYVRNHNPLLIKNRS